MNFEEKSVKIVNESRMNDTGCRMKTRSTGLPKRASMMKAFLFLICLVLILALTACQPKAAETLTDDHPALINMPTGVPGEPEGVPTEEING